MKKVKVDAVKEIGIVCRMIPYELQMEVYAFACDKALEHLCAVRTLVDGVWTTDEAN